VNAVHRDGLRDNDAWGDDAAQRRDSRALREVLDCLRRYGQRLDLEIAQETGLALDTVRRHLASLAESGAVISCSLTRFEKGRRIDALQCRVSGYVPQRAPGRKPTTAP
jgi:predicted ArsR family transcriptional regulator